MATVTYRDGIAILQLIFFPVLLVASLYIWRRIGWRAGSKTWRFVSTLSLIRIVGSICTLVAINNDNANVRIAEAVCELIGLAPLLLIYVGLLRQIDTSQRLPPRFLHLLTVICFTGLILGIVGISIMDKTKPFHPTGIVKAAMALFLVVFAVTVLATVRLALELQSRLSAAQKEFFLAIVLSWPFLAVRLVFSAIADFANDDRFAVLKGDPTIYLCMAVLEEIVAMGLCVGFGMSVVWQTEREAKRFAAGDMGSIPVMGRV